MNGAAFMGETMGTTAAELTIGVYKWLSTGRE